MVLDHSHDDEGFGDIGGDKRQVPHFDDALATQRRRAGGPRTAQGKEISSRNSLKHGIFSLDPVAGPEETPEDWDAFLQGQVDDHGPHGVAEHEIVYNYAWTQWMLRRVHRQFRDITRLRAGRVELPVPVQLVKPARSRITWSAYKRPRDARTVLYQLGDLNDACDCGKEEIADLLQAIEDFGPVDVEAPTPGPACPAGSVAYVRKLITVAALAWNAPEETVIAAMTDNLTEAHMAATKEEQRLRDRQLARSRQRDRQARAHLPDYDEMDTLLRYKKSLENSSEKLLRQLETLQRARLGTLPAPLRVQGLEE